MKFRILFLLMIVSVLSNAQQTFNPTQGISIAKPLHMSNGGPVDGRSMKYDMANFLWRPYKDTAEVKEYLNLTKYRTGKFTIYVKEGGTLNANGTFTGGTLTEWWFRDTTLNSGLIRKTTEGGNPDSLGGQPAAYYLARANHTGTQAISTVSGLQAAIDAKLNITDTANKQPRIIAGTNITLSGSFPNVIVSASGGLLPDTVVTGLAARGDTIAVYYLINGTDVDSAHLIASIPIDATPTNASTNAVQSDGVFDALVLKADKNIVSNTQTASYTLVLADAGKSVKMNVGSANNLTIPPNADVAFEIGTRIDIIQWGAGATTIVAGAGVTIRSSDGHMQLYGQYAGATAEKVATNEWIIYGKLITP